jgi:hypothetical protein
MVLVYSGTSTHMKLEKKNSINIKLQMSTHRQGTSMYRYHVPVWIYFSYTLILSRVRYLNSKSKRLHHT